MVNYYGRDKSTYANHIVYDKVATFRNGDAELSSDNTSAIDYPPGRVDIVDPEPIHKKYRNGYRNIQFEKLIKYDPGRLTIPAHPIQTGKMYAIHFSECTTTSAAGQSHSHDLADVTSDMYFYAFHGEMENITDNVRKVMLGNYMTRYTLEWGQDIPLTQTYEGKVAKTIDSSADIAPLKFSSSYNYFTAGAFSHTFAYNSTSLAITVLSGRYECAYEWDEHKVGDDYINEVILKSKTRTLTLQAKTFEKRIFDIPDTMASYASALTHVGTWWRNSSTDYISMSNSSLKMAPVHPAKTSDETYLWQGELIFTDGSGGATTGLVIDSLSANHYESA